VFVELGRRGYKLARRIAIAAIGGTVVLLGIVMVFTPGPALVVIPVGLTILAAEFAFARRWLHELKSRLTKEQLTDLMKRTRQLATKGSLSGATTGKPGDEKSESPHGH
jgi:hypothetical protein